MTDPKIRMLRAAIARVTRVCPTAGLFGVNVESSYHARFVALWKCRNRRTRVQMFKARDANR